MSRTELRIPIRRRPPLRQAGDIACIVEESLVRKSDEIAIGLKFICNRQLFGSSYRLLMPRFFDQLGVGSGVFISAFVPTKEILPNIPSPGDIDLLVIPYEGNDLIVSRTLGIELKIVRARFEDQGKSPNEFGFTQGRALLAAGVPFAAVGHLIISNQSPLSSWTSVLTTQVIDSDSGRVHEPWMEPKDMLPRRLLERSHGRLQIIPNRSELGLFTAYVGEDGVWQPLGVEAIANPQVKDNFVRGVAAYYERSVGRFMDTPKYHSAA